MRRTKIVATIGPSSSSEKVVHDMIGRGMDVARLNFSHATHADHAAKIKLIRRAAAITGKHIAILQDLAGPKIRIGAVAPPGITLRPGDKLTLTNRNVPGRIDLVSLSYKKLPEEVKAGDRLLLADGAMELMVENTDGTNISCSVVTGGLLTSHKGINLPSTTISAPPLTEKDKKDLRFGMEHGVDYVALSFVTTAADIEKVKDIISSTRNDAAVIAKIEKHEAINNIDAIIAASDGIMVARGDLGVEISPEEVPLIQKMLIKKANLAGKPVITATQMLRSMTDAPRPTRAEAADVANAVLDGTDALMLSEETATGAYPVEAVSFMHRLAQAAETGFMYDEFLKMTPAKTISSSVAQASCVMAAHLGAAAIVAHTQSGATARHISRFRPRQPILALSTNERTARKLALLWGCLPLSVIPAKSADEMIEIAAFWARETVKTVKGDIVVITMGHPVGKIGATNMLRVKVT